MAQLKKPRITGQYGGKTRLLQKRLSYERSAHTMKNFFIHKYIGAATESNPSLDDIQDTIFMEVRDRAYEEDPVEINGWMDSFQDQVMDLSQFGVVNILGETHRFRFHSYSFEADGLGRTMIVGDIIEIPFLKVEGKKTYFEVTDVNRKQEPETFTILVTATPLRDKQETKAISGYQEQGLMDTLQNDLDDEFNNTLTEQGLDTSDLDVTVDEQERYDPRNKPGRDFLDDPNTTLF